MEPEDILKDEIAPKHRTRANRLSCWGAEEAELRECAETIDKVHEKVRSLEAKLRKSQGALRTVLARPGGPNLEDLNAARDLYWEIWNSRP